MVLQALAIGGLALATWQLIDGTGWLVAFVPLVALLVFWVGQAVHAHRRAIALGGAPGGELQLALFLPFAFAVLTSFWLIGGRHGSAASTVEAYMDAWMAGRPDAAAGLLSNTDVDTAALQRYWDGLSIELTSTVSAGRTKYGSGSGLDPARPFNSLRVTQIPSVGSGRASFRIEIVRSERFETTLLGFIPTAGQRTIVVEALAQITLIEEPVTSGWLAGSAWRVAVIWSSDSQIP